MKYKNNMPNDCPYDSIHTNLKKQKPFLLGCVMCGYFFKNHENRTLNCSYNLIWNHALKKKIQDPNVKQVKLRCPECGRIQVVDVEFYHTSLEGHPLTCNGGLPPNEHRHNYKVILEPVELIKE